MISFAGKDVSARFWAIVNGIIVQCRDFRVRLSFSRTSELIGPEMDGKQTKNGQTTTLSSMHGKNSKLLVCIKVLFLSSIVTVTLLVTNQFENFEKKVIVYLG